MAVPRSDPAATRRAIVAAIRGLPRGRVAAYGQVAAMAGLPGRARLVARVLAESPPGLRLPWHRVLRSDGRIAFAAGSAAFDEQVRRLRAEGVEVIHGRVARGQFAGTQDLDAALWAP